MSGAWESHKIPVIGISILTSGEPLPSVLYALEILQRFCRESPGISVRHVDSLMDGGSDLLLIVGMEAATKVADELLLPVLELSPDLGEEGYVLRVFQTVRGPCAVAAGMTWAGTRHAVLEFLNRLDVCTSPPSIPASLSVREKPGFGLRGMYAHQHWAYNYPYAVRTWSVGEWKRYVDMLALLHANLFQIWSMAGICPFPLSEGDAKFLQRYPPVIDHARTNHGFEVWIGECANNVAEGRNLPPAAERRYFDVEVRKNPSDPKAMETLEEARRGFYSLCNNADGYWIIDSDPGGWDGSPSSEFVSILEMNRRLMDKCTLKGQDAKLIYWMWLGWGTSEDRSRNWREALEGIRDRIHPPWWIEICSEDHWRVAERFPAGLSRAVYYPYGAIEPEPSLPFTLVMPPALTSAMDVKDKTEKCAGALGNAQTPHVQWPNIFYFLECAWDPALARGDPNVFLEELSRRLFPKHAELLRSAWVRLGSPLPEEAEPLAERLDQVAAAGDFGAPGPLGWLLFPGPVGLFRDLALQLRIHSAAADFCLGVKEGRKPDEDLLAPLIAYHVLSVVWRRRTGFRLYPNNGYDYYPLREAVQERWWTPRGVRGDVLERLRGELTSRFGEKEAGFSLMPINQKMQGRKP